MAYICGTLLNDTRKRAGTRHLGKVQNSTLTLGAIVQRVMDQRALVSRRQTVTARHCWWRKFSVCRCKIWVWMNTNISVKLSSFWPLLTNSMFLISWLLSVFADVCTLGRSSTGPDSKLLQTELTRLCRPTILRSNCPSWICDRRSVRSAILKERRETRQERVLASHLGSNVTMWQLVRVSRILRFGL